MQGVPRGCEEGKNRVATITACKEEKRTADGAVKGETKFTKKRKKIIHFVDTQRKKKKCFQCCKFFFNFQDATEFFSLFFFNICHHSGLRSTNKENVLLTFRFVDKIPARVKSFAVFC